MRSVSPRRFDRRPPFADWAKIAGKKGERIVYVKPLVSTPSATPAKTERVVATGQYL